MPTSSHEIKCNKRVLATSKSCSRICFLLWIQKQSASVLIDARSVIEEKWYFDKYGPRVCIILVTFTYVVYFRHVAEIYLGIPESL